MIELTLRHHELEASRQRAGKGMPSAAEHRWWWLRGGCWTGAIFDRVVLNRDVLRSMIEELSGVERSAGDVPHIVAELAFGLDGRARTDRQRLKEHERTAVTPFTYSSPMKSGGAPCASSSSYSKGPQ